MSYPKSVEIYSREGRLYFQSLTKIIPHGPLISNDYVAVLDSTVENEKVGETLLDSLDHSDAKDSYPPGFQPGGKDFQLLKIMGVKNWNALAFPDTKVVNCSLEESSYVFIPTKANRVGKRAKGFSFKGEDSHLKLSPDSSVGILGKTIREAFERSE